MMELSALFGTGTLELGNISILHRPVTQIYTVRRIGHLFTITPSRAHVLTDRAATLDIAKGVFFEAIRGKNQALYLYMPELLICVKGIAEIIFYFVFSFTVKEGFKKERRPIANKELLYQLSLLPHFFASWCNRYNHCRRAVVVLFNSLLEG